MNCDEYGLYVSVSDPSTTLLMRWSPSGIMLWNKTLSVRIPQLWVDNMGYIYVSSYSYLAKWTELGVQVWNVTTAGLTTYTMDVRGDNLGSVYICDWTHLEKWTTSGSLVWSKEWGGANYIDTHHSIYADNESRLYTAGSTRSFAALNVFQFDPSDDAVLLKWNANTGDTEHPLDWRHFIPQVAVPFIVIGGSCFGCILVVYLVNKRMKKKHAKKEP